MIPTIEQIINDLLAGDVTKEQAINWLYQHAEPVSSELRDMYAGMAMPAVYSNAMSEASQGSGLFQSNDWRIGLAMDAYALADAMMKARES